MIDIDNQLSLNRILLLANGLWPYQKSKLAQLYSLSCFTILTTFVIFQLTTFVTSKCTIELVLQVLSSTTAFSIIIIMYYLFYKNSKIVKYLIVELKHIYNNLKDKNEITIIKRYANYGKRFTIIGTTLVTCALLFIMGVQLWPILHDIIFLAKVSCPQCWQLRMEYFINEKNYFYLLLLHFNICIIIGCLTMSGIVLFFIVYFQYICAMFQIASYRIKHAMQIYTVQRSILLNEKMICNRIVCAIDIHRKAMMICDKIMSTFEVIFTILLILTVIVIILNFYCMFRAVSLRSLEDFAMPCFFGLSAICFIFLLNLVAQQITDTNEHIFVTAYKIRWYLAPVHIQRLILFLLQRGIKPFGLKIGLFMGSLQCFLMISNTAASYCTVMYSIGL